MINANRARGLMVGLAVGNLLGVPMESRSRQTIAQTYPAGVQDIMAKFGYPDDDDLAQAIEIADAASAHDGLDIDDLGQRFWTWSEVSGLGIGGLTWDVLSLYGGHSPQRLACFRNPGEVRKPSGVSIVEASQEAWNGDRAGNGALMRCAPLAIRWYDNPHRLVRESVLSAIPTHWDWRCGWSCALANLAVAAVLRGEMLCPKALQQTAEDGMAASLPALQPYGYRPDMPSSVSAAVNRASQSNLDELRLDGDNMGFTLLSLQVGLISYWRAEDFESGLRQVIELGGDTDTNGAIVGAILGGRFGLEAIPERWRRSVTEIRTGRVSLESMADRLVAAALPDDRSGSS